MQRSIHAVSNYHYFIFVALLLEHICPSTAFLHKIDLGRSFLQTEVQDRGEHHALQTLEPPQVYSVIIWSASFPGDSATSAESGVYCFFRYGPKNSTWDEKLQGTGRISETVVPEVSPKEAADVPGTNVTSDPTAVWKLGTIVLGSPETELSVQVHVSTGELLKEVSVVVGDVLAIEHMGLPLQNGGLVQLTVAQGGKAPNFQLSKYGVAPSEQYEAAAPIAQQQVVNLTQMSSEGPLIVGTAPLPPNLQGLWWLTEQGPSSALVSFGGPNNDGNGCSLGYLSGPKNSYKIRTEGDRVFSSSEAAVVDKIAEPLDQSYNFEFNDAAKPTRGQIYVHFDRIGLNIHGATSQHMMDFEMHLLKEDDPRRKPYPGSLVWLRNTSVWHINAGEDYLLVQVMNGEGKKIEPAWSKFVAFENSKAAGSYPNWMFYKSDIPSPSPGADAILQELEPRVRRNAILLSVGSVVLMLICFVAVIWCCFRCCGIGESASVKA